jgi:hypothetical protein
MTSNERRNPNLVWPLVLIVAGVVLLLNQSGHLPWSVWTTLLRFWPLLFVLLGLGILIGVTRSTVLYVAGLFTAACLLIGAVLFAAFAVERRAIGGEGPAVQTFIAPGDDADRAAVYLDLALGSLNLEASQNSANLLEATIYNAYYSEQAIGNTRVSGGRAEVSLRSDSRPTPLRLSDWGDLDRWDLLVATGISLELNVNSGAASLDLDLRSLRLTSLKLDCGAGRVRVAFPEAAGRTTASLSVGLGEVTLEIPEEVGARIRVEKALVAVRVDNPRFDSVPGGFQSDNYDLAPNTLELEIDAAIGSVVIR